MLDLMIFFIMVFSSLKSILDIIIIKKNIIMNL